MKLWNLDDGSCICTWTIPDSLPIEDMIVAGDVAYVTYFWRNSDAGRVLAFDLIKGGAKEMRVKLSIICSKEASTLPSFTKIRSDQDGSVYQY